MKSTKAQPLKQIHAVFGPHGHAISQSTDAVACGREQDVHEARLLEMCSAELWPKGSYEQACARPILMTEHHQHQMEKLHEALTLAITDIVDRWWTDDAAAFPQRMPLTGVEEGLLQWMDGQVPHNLPEFREVLGSWRPDFLVADGPHNELYPTGEVFCVTEINARFSLNGYMHEAYGQQALLDLGIEQRGLQGATDPAKLIGGLCSLLRFDRPLHLLKGQEKGIDIHMFVEFLRRHLGMHVRIIAPEDLRLVPDSSAVLGYKLCCAVRAPEYARGALLQGGLMLVDGEVVEEIHQVGLELHQRELLGLPTKMLRAISLRCFNDLRTVLLVHDKRMLGIVREELGSLVRRSVLSEAQADIVRHGVAETLLPGSVEVQDLLQRSRAFPELRNEFLLKPIRGGKGSGIVFGDEMQASEWISCLEKLDTAQITPGRESLLIQRQVKQRLYDVVLGRDGKHTRYPLIGTYHVVHGQLLGLGIWRSSPGRITAVSNGGSWVCSVLQN
ncbi:uncharacterized protein C8A04DRAFT_32914 [Dichotomopilus funicola]|uniref:Uncharacterized protein n=1 Tax=Dichotomopilus funicola TaxID=1934379 RepID=A0AAN6UUZ8_9PEZI|nr:hypothetical protein C8A04DRAFT_32914 [Dichotomopilus funicola]